MSATSRVALHGEVVMECAAIRSFGRDGTRSRELKHNLSLSVETPVSILWLVFKQCAGCDLYLLISPARHLNEKMMSSFEVYFCLSHTHMHKTHMRMRR